MKNINWFYILLLVIIIACVFGFLFLSVYLNKKYEWGISSTNVVLAFVGILATFIVVSNYAQVKEIENKCRHQIITQQRKFNKSKTDLDNIAKALDAKIEKLDKDYADEIFKIDTDFEYNLGLVFYDMKNYPFAIKCSYLSIVKNLSSSNQDLIKQNIDLINDCLQFDCISNLQHQYDLKFLLRDVKLKISYDKIEDVIRKVEKIIKN